MVTEAQERRKFPRLFLAHRDQDYKALVDCKIRWPDGKQSVVMDISYAGIASAQSDFTRKYQVGQELKVELKILNNPEFTLAVQVVRVTEQILGLSIQSTTAEGRLKIDQYLKDQIIGLNTRMLSPDLLIGDYKSDIWFHGPFDTNLMIWRGANNSVKKSVIEYDNTVLSYELGQFKVIPSVSTIDGNQTYASPYQTHASNKLALGNSWVERLLRLMVQVKDPKGDLKPLLQLINSQQNKLI